MHHLNPNIPHTPRMAPPDPFKPWKLPPQKTYILTNANIIDVLTGTVLANRTLTLSNGLIKFISPTETEDSYISISSPSEIVINLNGKFITPGLIDAHMHISAVPGEKDLKDLSNLDHTISLLRQPYVVSQILRRGITSVRDCGGATLALKEAIEDGAIHGPRIFIAGKALSQTGGHGDPRSAHTYTSSSSSLCCGGGNSMMSLSRVCDGVSECIAAAREELRLGADFIKIMAGGGVASPTDALDSVQFTGAEIRAIVEVARNAGTYVTAHAYTPRAIRHAVENGVSGIEHGNLLDEETARYLSEKGVYLTPTLVTYRELASEHWTGFLNEEQRKKNVLVLEEGLKSLRIAREAGVVMCFGTDLLGPLTAKQTGEFALRAKALSSEEILRSATVNPARRVGKGDVLGQVKEGFVADLLVLNENPLEDVTVFDRPEKHLLAVIKEGRVYHSRWSKLPQDVLPNEKMLE